MPPYFHCAPIPLAPDSVIEPGNWGRVIRLYEAANGQVSTQALNEMALEMARLATAPDKPSRLSCLFVLPSLAEAKAYRDRHSKTSLIYQVEPVGLSKVLHVGDYEAAIRPHAGRYFDVALETFRQYWTNVSPAFPEILLPCPVRVISREEA